MDDGGRYDITVRVAALELVPAVPQVVAEQVIEAVGQVAVTLVLDTGLGVGGLLLGLAAVLVAELVDRSCVSLRHLVYPYLPDVIAVENLVDELTARRLRRLLAQQLHLRAEHTLAERVGDNRVVVDTVLAGRRALQSRRGRPSRPRRRYACPYTVSFSLHGQEPVCCFPSLPACRVSLPECRLSYCRNKSVKHLMHE